MTRKMRIPCRNHHHKWPLATSSPQYPLATVVIHRIHSYLLFLMFIKINFLSHTMRLIFLSVDTPFVSRLSGAILSDRFGGRAFRAPYSLNLGNEIRNATPITQVLIVRSASCSIRATTGEDHNYATVESKVKEKRRDGDEVAVVKTPTPRREDRPMQTCAIDGLRLNLCWWTTAEFDQKWECGINYQIGRP